MSYLSDLLGSAYKEGMTEEEISTALKAVRDNNEAEVTRLKNALSKANTEAAEYKKQLRTKQTDDEAAETARKEEHDKLVQENADLKRSITLSEKKAKLLASDALSQATGRSNILKSVLSGIGGVFSKGFSFGAAALRKLGDAAGSAASKAKQLLY